MAFHQDKDNFQIKKTITNNGKDLKEDREKIKIRTIRNKRKIVITTIFLTKKARIMILKIFEMIVDDF